MVQQAIYESLLVFNPAKGNTAPWLATDWKAAADGKSVTFTLRDGVKWSDGQPFVADDVAYTFELQKKLKGGFEYLKTSPQKATRSRSTSTSRGLRRCTTSVSSASCPSTSGPSSPTRQKDANAKPVGTGPYTEVDNFQAQSFVLKKNPNYWQPEKQKIAGIKMLAFAGNDGANLAAANGDVDWAPQFIPNIEKTFVSKDKDHRHYWFPPTGAMINWQLNTTKAPFNDVDVRKALSMAVDRDQVTKIGMSGYAQPADCTGLSGNYETVEEHAVKDNCTWTKRRRRSQRSCWTRPATPRAPTASAPSRTATPFEFKISVGATSSDWLSVANVISQNLAEVGVTAKVDSPDWAAVVAGYENGRLRLRHRLERQRSQPVQVLQHLHGHRHSEAGRHQDLRQLPPVRRPQSRCPADGVRCGDGQSKQKDIANKLQEEYNDAAPLVPLFSGPEWGAYNDTRFTGWPTQDNPYATLSIRSPTTVLVLTSLEPRK